MQPNTDILFLLAAAAALLFMLAGLAQWRSAQRAKAHLARLELERAKDAHLADEAERLRAALQLETEKRFAAEKDVILAQQRLADMDQRIRDAEEFKKAALASVLEGGQTLSTKLLEDHKREAATQSQTLLQQFERLTQSVAAIQSRTLDNTQRMEVVMRALTHPGGAGQMAEAGLENALKSLSLEPERDFILQYHIAGEEGNLRPDAVVFLSQDMVVVIDSKASKFLMEMAEAPDAAAEEAALKRLLASMHAHLDALARKDYAEALARLLKEKGRRLGRKLMVMYLPSEAMIERLHKADRGLESKCLKHQIVLSGPASLAAILSLSRQQIAQARQDENQEKILAELRLLITHFAAAMVHLDGTGKAIQQAAERFRDFGKSLNARVLPKLNKLQDMGVEAKLSKPLPRAIPVFDVQRADQLLQLEAEEEQPRKALEGV